MRFFLLLTFTLSTVSCGFKSTPVPIFPTSMHKNIDGEVWRRNQELTDDGTPSAPKETQNGKKLAPN
jgi:hypothetical protein